jgi:hypothetical protein
MKNAVFWDVASCGSCVNRRFGGTYRLNFHAGSSLADFSTLKMEAIRSSERSVHTRSTRHHIPEDGILQMNNLFNVIHTVISYSMRSTRICRVFTYSYQHEALHAMIGPRLK